MTFRTVVRWTARTVLALVGVAAAGLAIAYWRSDNECAARAAAPPTQPMKAVRYCDYGGPEVLTVQDVETPSPSDDQVLVRVHAAAVNPVELHYMRGTPYFMRLDAGLRRPAVVRLGVDFSGTVTAVGPRVTRFKTGDAVFGARNGALAEFVAAPERLLAPKPARISFEQAAAVPVAALTALQALRDHGRLQPGQRVLINGASGGVGTFAVQIAKALGGEVTGVSSGRNLALVRSLGADHAVDYTAENYTAGAARYDLIVDMVGNHPLLDNRRVLTPHGAYVMVGGPDGRWIAPVDRVIRMVLLSPFIEQRFGMMLSTSNQADLATLSDLMQAGHLTPVIDRSYPLREVAEAIRYLETGRARGKVVITVTG